MCGLHIYTLCSAWCTTRVRPTKQHKQQGQGSYRHLLALVLSILIELAGASADDGAAQGPLLGCLRQDNATQSDICYLINLHQHAV